MDNMFGHLIMVQQRSIEALAYALQETNPEAYKKYGEKARQLIEEYAEQNPSVKELLEQIKADGKLPNWESK